MEIGLHFTPLNLKIYKYIQNEVFNKIKTPGSNFTCSKKRKNLNLLRLLENLLTQRSFQITFTKEETYWLKKE